MRFAAILSALVSCLSAAEVRFLAWDDSVAAREVALIDGGGGAQPVRDLHPLQRSPALPAPAGEGLKLRLLDRQDDSGRPVELAVRLSAGIQRPLVLLLPDPTAPGGLRGHALEDSDVSFRWGSFRVLNASGQALTIRLGGKRHALPAGWTPLDLHPEGGGALPVALVAAADAKRPLYAGAWKPDPDLRRLVIVVPGTDPRHGPLALKVIPEDRRALAETP
jgi:hypothetical protein